MASKQQTILMIGAGPNDIQHGDEVDSATFSVAHQLHLAGYRTILIDNNPFSFSLGNRPVIDHCCIGPLTVEHLVEIIDKYHPTAILPTLGNRQAFLLTQELLDKGVLRQKNIHLLGVPEATIRQVNNPVLLEQTLRQMEAPMKKIVTVNNYQDALQEADLIGYPVIVRSVWPKSNSTRQIVHDRNDLSVAVKKCLDQSRAGQIFVQQSLAGYKEIEVVVQRDQTGTMMMLSMVEDMDPIGIHAGDSIAFNPAQTLLDRQIQDIRDVAFAITRKLRIVGINHLQFALDPASDKFYVIKNSPYFDRMVSFVEQSTGYPVAEVCAQLYTGKSLREIDLGDNFQPHAALMEPTMDHIAARIPVWAFEINNFEEQLLGTEKRSIGTVFGVGRSPAEALFKAIESRYHEPTDFHLNTQRKLNDDQIVDRIVHPHAGRMFTLLEAMERGYTVEELAEMTKIDPFYFDQLNQMRLVLRELQEHPGKEPVLNRAKKMGLTNRLIARLWGMEPSQVYQMTQDHDLTLKYKEIEPSAGEFDQHTATFYSAYEDENEATTLSQPSALVVGTGGIRLGLSNSGDFFLASALTKLHELGYHTIVINSNPSSITLNREIADKRYIEPPVPENILSVIECDQPQMIFIPASYTDLVVELRQYNLQAKIIEVPDDRMLSNEAKEHPLLSLNFLFDGQQAHFIASTNDLLSATDFNYQSTQMRTPAEVDSQELTRLMKSSTEVITSREKVGFYQVVFEQVGEKYQPLVVQAIPLPELAFLSKSTGINWPAQLINLIVDQDAQLTFAGEGRPAIYRATFPFKALGLTDERPSANLIIGAQMQILN